jgi:hypothetical protein
MKKISIFSTGVMALLLWCFINPLIAYEGDSEKQSVIMDTIISTHMDPETGQLFIDLRNASYPVFRNIKVYNPQKKRCRLMSLQLPFIARIVMMKNEQGIWSVIEIKPHEE